MNITVQQNRTPDYRLRQPFSPKSFITSSFVSVKLEFIVLIYIQAIILYSRKYTGCQIGTQSWQPVGTVTK